MTDQEIDAYCDRWAYWCFTRKYFAPPVQSNILARLQPRRVATSEPDAELDPQMPFFNMAVHGLCEEGMHDVEAICFAGVYWYSTNIKVLATEQKISRGTVYNRARRFAERARMLSKTIRRIHTMSLTECSIPVEQNSCAGY